MSDDLRARQADAARRIGAHLVALGLGLAYARTLRNPSPEVVAAMEGLADDLAAVASRMGRYVGGR